jgi:lipoprotein-releasing system permease protein
MTTMSILGVMIGVAALVLVLSVMGGFEADLQRKMLAGEPNVEILATNAVAGFSLKRHSLIEFKKKFPEAQAIVPFVAADVVLKRKNFVTSASMIAVDPSSEGAKLWAFDGAFSEGKMAELKEHKPPVYSWSKDPNVPLPGIALGDQLAQQINADVGDEITVLSPSTSSAAALSGATIAKQFVVIGKISTGLFNYDGKWAVTNIQDGRSYLADYDESLAEQEYVTGVAFNVKDPMKVDLLSKRLPEESGLKVHTWHMTNKSLLFALKLEKFAMGAILMLIVLVAAFSISGTMMMTVHHKRSQVSILRALGMPQSHITRLYLAHGFTIGTVGIVLGLGLGLGLCSMIRYTRLIPLPAEAYYVRSLPVKYLPMDYGIICICTWVFSIVAAIYPAWMASKQIPSRGLRYE